MAKKIKIKLLVNEDGFSVLSPFQKEPICHIGRDDDSCIAAEEVLVALGFDVEIVDSMGS